MENQIHLAMVFTQHCALPRQFAKLASQSIYFSLSLIYPLILLSRLLIMVLTLFSATCLAMRPLLGAVLMILPFRCIWLARNHLYQGFQLCHYPSKSHLLGAGVLHPYKQIRTSHLTFIRHSPNKDGSSWCWGYHSRS